MEPISGTVRISRAHASWLAAVTVLWFATALDAAQGPKLPPGYVGSSTCELCHSDIAQAFGSNPHHLVETGVKPGWKGMACEACHGPGAKHAESVSPSDIRNPARLTAEETDRLCLKCHLNRPARTGWVTSSHFKEGVACTSCHSVHQGMEKLRPTKAATINRLCSNCHNSVWAEFQRPYKHRLPEGAMSCTDCHSPHGSVLPRAIRTTMGNQPGCFRCHSNLRGPFTYEHAPVRLEGCATCHEPHGSANPRMLVRHEVRFLCLECHSNITVGGPLGGNPPGFHDLRSARYRNCTICHTKIHGSYVDAYLER
jgi:DmsE family decaheme c-type cytochrome